MLIATNLTPKTHQRCTSVHFSILLKSGRKLRAGVPRADVVAKTAIDDVLPQLSDDDKRAIKSAVEVWKSKVVTSPNDQYGVLDLFTSSDALRDAVVCARIDEVVQSLLWRDAFRTALMGASTPLLSDNIREQLSVLTVARVFEEGHMLQQLYSLNVNVSSVNSSPCDMLSMYGVYVHSQSVSTRDILKEAAQSADVDANMPHARLQAMMWNLTALDLNGHPSDADWEERLCHNLDRANVPGILVYQSIQHGQMTGAVDKFIAEISTARLDAACFVRRRGVTYVSGLRIGQFFAWIYIETVITIATLCASYNWPGRDNNFDRAKDAFDIATLFLISVFGLIKLTSEDPNALKSLAVGRSLVDDLDDASGLLLGEPDGVQKLLCVDQTAGHWAMAEGCSYGRDVEGDGLDTGPAIIATLKQCGFFLLESLCKRPYFWDTTVVIRNSRADEAVIFDEDSDLNFLLCDSTRYSRVG